jgi:hypothetical protein
VLEKFQTETETILEIWSQAMAESLNRPKYTLEAKYLDRFFAEVSELGINRIPAWVLRKTALKCVREVKDGHKLSLKNWKEEARRELLKEKTSDLVTDPDGTTWVIEGSPTDIGRKLIGPVQNYSDDA